MLSSRLEIEPYDYMKKSEKKVFLEATKVRFFSNVIFPNILWKYYGQILWKNIL